MASEAEQIEQSKRQLLYSRFNIYDNSVTVIPMTAEEFQVEWERKKAEVVERMTQADRPARHISAQAGDKIWLDRTRLTLKPDKALSDESVEVIDVVEKG